MDTEFIRIALQKLRADLSATNKALLAIAAELPSEQRTAVAQRFAQLSVLNEQTALQIPKQVAPETLQAMREAEEQMYKMLVWAQTSPTR